MNNKDNSTWWNNKYPFLRVTNNSVYPWLTEEDSWADEIPIGWRDSFFENMCDDLIFALGDYVDNFEIICFFLFVKFMFYQLLYDFLGQIVKRTKKPE